MRLLSKPRIRLITPVLFLVLALLLGYQTTSPDIHPSPANQQFLIQRGNLSDVTLTAAYRDLGLVKKTSLEAINTDILRASANSKLSQTQVISALKDRGIQAHPDHRVSILTTPNDPYYSLQWAPPAIKADATWDSQTGSTSETIAIIDTGIQLDHPDLSPNLLSTGYNFVADNSNPNDDNGHGTHVAGIAAADGNNGIGISGTCWSCKLLPIKVLDSAGSGYTSDIAAGVLYAVNHGANVINMSLGTSQSDPTLSDAVQYALSHNVVVVAAAGNNGTTTPMYPAAYPGVISVASAGQNGRLSSFSTYGNWVSTVAPGESIASTYMGASYAYLSGTSMASPFVAGEAALLLSAHPTFSVAQVKNAIVTNTDPVSSYTDKKNITHTAPGGQINILAAVGPTSTPAPSTPTPSPVTLATPVPVVIDTPSDLPPVDATPSAAQPTPAPALVITQPPVDGVAPVVAKPVIPKDAPVTKKKAAKASPTPSASPTPTASPSPTPALLAALPATSPSPTVLKAIPRLSNLQNIAPKENPYPTIIFLGLVVLTGSLLLRRERIARFFKRLAKTSRLRIHA